MPRTLDFDAKRNCSFIQFVIIGLFSFVLLHNDPNVTCCGLVVL